MDLTAYIDQQGHGAMSVLGRRIGVPPQTIRDWAVCRRQVPDVWCPSIEQATSGVITVERLRPDAPWARIPDPAWPHPQGRPVLDIAAHLIPLPSHAASADLAGTKGPSVGGDVQTAQKEAA